MSSPWPVVRELPLSLVRPTALDKLLNDFLRRQRHAALRNVELSPRGLRKLQHVQDFLCLPRNDAFKNVELSPRRLRKLQHVHDFLRQQRHAALETVELSQQGLGKLWNVQECGLTYLEQVFKKVNMSKLLAQLGPSLDLRYAVPVSTRQC